MIYITLCNFRKTNLLHFCFASVSELSLHLFRNISASEVELYIGCFASVSETVLHLKWNFLVKLHIFRNFLFRFCI